MGTKKIIDVSYHNGTINWEAVKSSGVDGAIIRCGYGDNITSQDDKQWKRNADECTRLGIPFGVYIYSYAKSDAQAKSEAEHVLRLIKGYKLSYPVYYDLEESGTQSGVVGRAKIFCEAIEAAGYWAGIYCNKSWWDNYLYPLGNTYTKWIARYNNTLGMEGVDMWQYTSDGSVSGISGRVDMNYCYRDFPSEITGNTGGSASTAPSAPTTSTPASTSKSTINFKYRVKAGGKWYPEVVNLNDYAGVRGKSITDIAIGVDCGSVWYQVHVKGGGWLPKVTGYNINDYNNGYAGNGKEIDAVRVYYNTPSDYASKYGYQKAQYRVSPVNANYYAWQYDNETGGGQDGYAGAFGKAIDRFQLF